MRNVAVIGCGQSKHGRRTDVNQGEMIAEAVWAAIEDAGIAPEDIEAFAVGNMQGFGGIAHPELWFGDWFGAQGKPVIRVATGGTVGGSVGHLGYYEVASGLHDVSMAVAWEKHSDSAEPGATTGLTHVGLANAMYVIQYRPPLKGLLAMGMVGAAAGISAHQAAHYMARSGCGIEHFDMVAARARRNAAKNKYAHLKWPGCTAEDMAKTELITWPVRFGHICPASDGASAIVYACEDAVKRFRVERPVAWVKGVGQYVDEEASMSESNQGTGIIDYTDHVGLIYTAARVYERAGIKDPRKEIDMAEIYQPFPWQELIYAERLGFFDDGKAWKAEEEGVMEIDGAMPTCPSGGVAATNAIGSSALQRILECALQITKKAGEHQVPKDVRNAVAHGWGAEIQFHTVAVLGDTPRW